jgi:hypothetical protein
MSEWRIIPGTRYEVSDDGQVRSWAKPGSRTERRDHAKVVRQSFAGRKYWRVTLEGRQEYVHRLVLEAFVGPCPEGLQCRHKDGNKNNNHLSNLCWGTPAENTADKDRHGQILRGDEHPMRKDPSRAAWGDKNGARLKPERVPKAERHWNARLTRADVAAIRGSSKTCAEIAAEHGLHRSYVARLRRGEGWAQ